MNKTVAIFMKTTKWVGLLSIMGCAMAPSVAQPPVPENPGALPPQAAASAAVPTDLSPSTTEVVKLSESGVGEDVILAYIQNSQAPFNLSAGDLLYLRDLGLSSQMITAMLNRDSALRSQVQPAQTAPPPPIPEPAPQEQGPPPDYVSAPPPAE